MNEFFLSDTYRKVFRTSFWATPGSIFVNLLFHIAAFAVKGYELIPLTGQFVYFVGMGISLVTVTCVLTMLFYPIIYLYHLWRIGDRVEFILGILMFVLYSLLMGYLWYYQKEIKGKDIQVGWPIF